MRNLSIIDLDYIFEQTFTLWEELRNKRIFFTGGTGYVGQWFLESFCWINKKLNLNSEAVVLTRNADSFEKKNPITFNNNALSFYKGNIIDFNYPNGNFYCIIHTAADAGINFEKLSDDLMLETITQGTKRILDFSNKCEAKKILFISSGYVYGKINAKIPFLDEEKKYRLGPLHSISAYALGKLYAEYLCALHAKKTFTQIKIARCFSSVGPYLPLNSHFAIGNFILNRLKNEDIVITSDGSPYRSYLYAADLCIWLWTILFQGKSLIPYNVGSDQRYTLREVATLVATIVKPKLKIKILQPLVAGRVPESFVPNISRARKDLHLLPKINLRESIEKTINFYRDDKYII